MYFLLLLPIFGVFRNISGLVCDKFRRASLIPSEAARLSRKNEQPSARWRRRASIFARRRRASFRWTAGRCNQSLQTSTPETALPALARFDLFVFRVRRYDAHFPTVVVPRACVADRATLLTPEPASCFDTSSACRPIVYRMNNHEAPGTGCPDDDLSRAFKCGLISRAARRVIGARMHSHEAFAMVSYLDLWRAD